MEWEKATALFRKSLKFAGRTESTIATYMREVEGYAWMAGTSSPLEVTPAIARDFVNRVGKGASPATLCKTISAVKSFHNWLICDDYANENPFDTIEGPKKEKKLVKVASISDIDKMLGNIKGDHVLQWKKRALLHLLYGSGLRVSEAVSLTWKNVNIDEGVIMVMGKGRKERLVPISSGFTEAVGKLPTDTATVIGIKKRAAQAIIERLAKKSGVGASAHTLRHSFATHMLEGGADIFSISTMLGHSSIAVTADNYLHVSQSHLRKSHAEFHPRG